MKPAEKMKVSAWLIGSAIAVLLLLSGGACFTRYHNMSAMGKRIENNRSRVEDILQGRNDLIPGLVSTVKGYAPHDQRIFDQVARARVGMAEATDIGALAEANVTMEKALAGVVSVADTCRPLRDDRSFNEMREELADAEGRVSAECRLFNETVQEYNLCLESFPNNVIAGIFGFRRETTVLAGPFEAMDHLVFDKSGRE